MRYYKTHKTYLQKGQTHEISNTIFSIFHQHSYLFPFSFSLFCFKHNLKNWTMLTRCIVWLGTGHMPRPILSIIIFAKGLRLTYKNRSIFFRKTLEPIRTGSLKIEKKSKMFNLWRIEGGERWSGLWCLTELSVRSHRSFDHPSLSEWVRMMLSESWGQGWDWRWRRIGQATKEIGRIGKEREKMWVC